MFQNMKSIFKDAQMDIQKLDQNLMQKTVFKHEENLKALYMEKK